MSRLEIGIGGILVANGVLIDGAELVSAMSEEVRDPRGRCRGGCLARGRDCVSQYGWGRLRF